MEASEIREQIAELSKEIREKYADVINDLAVKHNVDVGIGFEMLKATARAKLLGLEPMYETEVEFDIEELVKDYSKLLALSEQL